MSYEPVDLCLQLGVRIVRAEMRSTWGAWVPQFQVIVLAHGLSRAQERCVLAHEVEHAAAEDRVGCGLGPYSESADLGPGVRLREAAADAAAARKLIPIAALLAAGRTGVVTADTLGVTERVLAIRLEDLGRGSWPLGRSKTAG